MSTAVGTVYLVGAGPGDPGLLTLRGAECLARADLVLYDYLASPRLLEHAPATAARVCLGHHGHGRIMSPEEVQTRMIDAALRGQTVVRLKSGDPLIFGRAAEEIAALRAAEVPFEIVPGVTAAMAAASHAGVPLTQRDGASAVALITGYQEQGPATSETLDFKALAAFPGTLVFYMGVTTAEHWTKALISAGRAANTPAAIVRRASWPDQLTIRCRLDQAASEIQVRRLRPPVVVIVGEVAGIDVGIDWFARRPLFGRRVLVTRPESQAGELVRQFEEFGARVDTQPAIQIAPPADWGPVDAALDQLPRYDWLVFSSANGVRYLLDRLLLTADVRRLGRVRLAAIGPGSAAELARYGLKADVQPDEYRAEALAAALVPQAAGKRFLLARASRGRELLADELRAAGGHVDQVVVYRSSDVEQADPEISQALSAGQIDFTTVTSSAIARSLVRMFGDTLRRTQLVSISPLTSEALRALGHEPAAEARQFTTAGVLVATVKLAANSEQTA
ncbi:MAG: uroporphyrinogen-III C-methyltransferase [Pirellulales bacterium]|nr:uroporphyrinogen-III C-methyltransferase [Pirellulales bacterium]